MFDPTVGWCDPFAGMEGGTIGQVRHGSPKTVAKCHKRITADGKETASSEPRSTALTEAEEAVVIACQPQALLLLDDCVSPLH